MPLSWMMLRKQVALTNVETWLLFVAPYQNSRLRAWREGTSWAANFSAKKQISFFVLD